MAASLRDIYSPEPRASIGRNVAGAIHISGNLCFIDEVGSSQVLHLPHGVGCVFNGSMSPI
jgi:hypothetical protein